MFFSANLENKEELQCESSDLDSRLYGWWIKDATAISERVRLTHGKTDPIVKESLTGYKF